VQYPAIAEAIQPDLRSTALVDRLTSLLFRGQEPGVFLAEIGARFSEECDYRVAAEHQESFRQKWLARPGVVIPRVFRELSTRRILVTELARGQSFAPFRAHASQAERDRAGIVSVPTAALGAASGAGRGSPGAYSRSRTARRKSPVAPSSASTAYRPHCSRFTNTQSFGTLLCGLLGLLDVEPKHSRR
jgi:hypothetical protein